ncbi:MAG TPA: NAD-dependent epimerase/dehydratase family protein [Solirubrobacteraceae bacterium]|nr:NAD-dependent epimerase/dehydratase family protein [Solirubrobacteraceae bacterium]
MKVLVTGGTGFVGSHTVRAIVEDGHDVRLFVRSPGRVAPALEPLGVRGVEHVVGDATDAESVRRAMDGCDAALHAAAIFSYDARDAREMQRVNARATEVVLGAARDAGLDPIVHVSSYVALLPAAGVLAEDSSVGDPRGVYARSKAETERMARQLQDQGAPVVITYPGMVWGPHDAHLGEAATFARSVLRGLVPVVPSGAVPVVDVRDVAAAHAAVLSRGRGPRRYMLASGASSLTELIDLMQRVTGRRLARATAPAPLVLGMTAAADVVQRVLPFRLPFNFGGVWVVTHGSPIDASATERDLGVRFRPLEDSIADMLRWLHAAGYLTDRQAGLAAAPAQSPTVEVR